MATCTVLTIRIDKNGAQRSASGAVFLDPAWSIPMIQSKFPPVSAKFVRLSVNLPTGSSNNPDTFRYTHFPPLMRRTISLRIPWGDPCYESESRLISASGRRHWRSGNR